MDLLSVVEKAWTAPFRTKSDYARENADAVAAAVSRGLITTSDSIGVIPTSRPSRSERLAMSSGSTSGNSWPTWSSPSGATERKLRSYSRPSGSRLAPHTDAETRSIRCCPHR